MQIKNKYKKFDNFIFDLDGTVWRWTNLIVDGAERVFEVLKKENKNYYFITNNTSLTLNGYVKKLKIFGIEAEPSQIFNPSLVAKRIFKGKRVYCIGEGIKNDLKQAKIELTDNNPNVVLVCEDRKINFEKLNKAVHFIYNGSKFYKVACGGKWIMGNSFILGSGAIANAIETCIGKEGILIGKPSEYMMKIIPKLKGKTLIIGDEIHSDIIFGKKLGFSTLLVLSGVEGIIRNLNKKYYPNFIEKNILRIIK
ncbi:MAG: HAD-IIA family hydrolase [Candidatus Aenigmatarchaeota archaeon]